YDLLLISSHSSLPCFSVFLTVTPTSLTYTLSLHDALPIYHAVQDDRRPGTAGRRRPEDRPERQDQLRRPEPREHRPGEEPLGGRLRRARLHPGRQGRDPLARLRLPVRLQGPGPAEEGRCALRRRAQPTQPGADPQAGRQRAAAR